MMIEREPGPSWARPNWPVAELDDINLGLDPTEATIEAVQEGGDRESRRSGPAADPDAIRRARRRFDPRDDADPHLSRARPPRRQARSARAPPAGTARRPDARISRLRPTTTSTGRSGSAGPWASNKRQSARSLRCCRPITAARSASNICTSTTWTSGASSRIGSRARTPRSSSRPRASSDPRQGHRSRAVGKVSCAQICRHEKIRARRRRKRGPGTRSGDQIWRSIWRRRRSMSEWPTAAGSTSCRT